MDLSLRWLVASDRGPIEQILLDNRPVFSDVECKTAVEMIDQALAQPDQEDPYQFLVAELDGKVVGYSCFGRIPLTAGSYDLYWIATAKHLHGKGVGQALLQRTEDEIAKQGGYVVVVETSSRKDYDATRRFYDRAGYPVAAQIKDFYKPGDDKVLYVKHLTKGDGRGA